MSTISPDDISTCANCGKGGEGDDDIQLKTCTACKMVKYCSRECQIAHRPQLKKECKSVLLNYTTRHCSNALHKKKTVQSAFYECRHLL